MFKDLAVQKNVQAWLDGPYDEVTKKELRRLLETDPIKVSDAFYTPLTFGTGGLRGLMGIGINRINRYTIRAATQGVADVLKKETASPTVCVGYDSRINSRSFAEETAKVFAGNGFRVYFFKELRPSPLVSFAVRHLECTAGIMITASHNPPEYNGYKVFWSNGGQILGPYDKEILQAIQEIHSPSQVMAIDTLEHPLIEQIDLDRDYLAAINQLRLHPPKTDLRILYTSLHGTGIALAPPALAQAGFNSIHLVAEQVDPDGTFPTCKSPNPEDPEALELGIKQLYAQKGDLLLATDPDADRMGAVVWHQGKAVPLTGNQIACICLYTLLKVLKSRSKLPQNAACIKTLATTELFRKICEDYGCFCFDVLIGFKHIAAQIGTWEKKTGAPHFLFGGEESFGYLLGDFTRDKDGITAAVLLAEAAAFAKETGKTLVDLLQEIYKKYGYFLETLTTFDFPETQEGRQKMAQKILQIKQNPPNFPLSSMEDYSASSKIDYINHEITPLTLPQSDTFVFHLIDGTKIVIRPSGTEPKIKVYCSVSDQYSSEFVADKAQNYISQIFDYLKN